MGLGGDAAGRRRPLAGLVALHARLAGRLLGPERRAWVLPATVVLALGAVLFLRAWVHQL